MNKIITLLFAAAVSLMAASCGNNKANQTEAEATAVSGDTVMIEEEAVELEELAAPDSLTYATASRGSSSRKFEKTRARCSKCGCTGYWGYKHQNGHYEGNCSNTDGHGHTCNHGPEKHGLKKW